MANITINDVNTAQLGAGQVAADDIFAVWDTSAGQHKRATRKAAIGAHITGNKDLVIPADGTAAIREVANVFGELVTVPAIMSGASGPILDDGVFSFTPSNNTGLIIIWNLMGGVAAGNRTAIIAYRAVATANCALLAQPAASIEVAASALTGTTGTDGKVTVAAASDGKIYIENRSGSSGNWAWLLLGNA